jgi:23S rRNA (adenine2503-C2)-methyltransferase
VAQPALNLHDLTRDELHRLIASWEFSPVHAARLWNYLYYEAVRSWSEMPEIPVRLLARLQSACTFGPLEVAQETQSTDGFTRKYLLSLGDGERIETVLMRYTGRVTACISSQVGCAMGCVFCATGQMGYTRHLTAGEIVAQALHVQRALRSPNSKPEIQDCKLAPDDISQTRLRNIVLMGMGEPLHNYDAVMKAIDILRDPNGLSLGAKKITLSTVGVVPGIIRMADEARPVHLAVSLHGATQEQRAALVPTAKRWPLDELMRACRYYIEKLDRRIFFEWTLIEGHNDSSDQARALGALLKGLQAQVNLIPLNPTAGFGGAPGRTEAAKKFQAVLAEYGLPSTVRQRRGIDIAAGCGQLAVGG